MSYFVSWSITIFLEINNFIAFIAFRKVKNHFYLLCALSYCCQFPKICVTLDSRKSKECCPIPKGLTSPCGSDGNRGTCQEVMIREWNFTYSHYKPFQEKQRHDWPNALYHKTCKCQSKFAGYDCSKCEFGYYGKSCTQKKILTRKNFAKLSAEKKDRYMRYINMSKYFESDYVVTSTPYEEINRTVQAGEDPASLFHNFTNYDLFVWMHYYAARDIIHPKQNKTYAAIDFAHDGQGFPIRGSDCTCLLGREPCSKFPVMTILLFLSGIGHQIKMGVIIPFALKTYLA